MAKKKSIKWITGTGISLIAILAILFSLPNVEVQHSGDISCGEKCVSYFNVTSKYKICFNVTSVIDTYPSVETELYWLYYGKWKLFNMEGGCIPANSKKQFKIVGYKESWQTIKWGMPSVNLDPIWYGQPCYQPNASQASSCGGLSTGSYSSCLGNWTGSANCSKAFDNNPVTYGYGAYPSQGGFFYINFSVPSLANRIGSHFYLLIGNGTGVGTYNLSLNLTVNESCWKNPLQYYLRSNQTIVQENIEVRCYNGTDWQLLYWKNLSNQVPLIRETGQWWNLSGYVKGEIYINSSPSAVYWNNGTNNFSIVLALNSSTAVWNVTLKFWNTSNLTSSPYRQQSNITSSTLMNWTFYNFSNGMYYVVASTNESNSTNVTLWVSDWNVSVSINAALNINISQNYAPNWSVISLNWSNPSVMAGNFTINLTQQNISVYPSVNYVFKFSTDKFAAQFAINKSRDSQYFEWWCYNGSWINVTATKKNILYMGTSQTYYMNCTLNLLNVSKTYVNWSVSSNQANWTFDYNISITVVS